VNSFYLKGKDSYEDFGIIINKLPPQVIAENNIDEFEIQGRDGTLTIDYDTRKSYALPIECTLLDSDKIHEVETWLSGGYNELVLSWDNNFKYEARLNNKIDIAQSMEVLGEFQLLFNVQPYKKSLSDNLVTLQATGTIYNSGDVISLPAIKVYGTGSITLTINGLNVYLTNVGGYVTIDSNLQDAFKDLVYKNADMSGLFPVLKVGNNTISWSGTVTKVEITPNLRWL